MHEIVAYERNLPATVEELATYVLIGEEKIKAYRAKLAAVQKLKLANDIERAAQADAQRMGKAVIHAKAKLGELLAAIPPKRDKQGSSKRTSLPSLPSGISKRTSHQAQAIAANPEKVEAAISQVVRKDDIPTPSIVYKLIKKIERQTERKKLVAKIPQGKFAVIYADPPWQYSNSGFNESAESQYPTMPTDEICKMAGMVAEWSTPETVLFMWATNPLLPDALRVMAAWGFTYKTNMAWIKDKGRGKGCFLMSKHELVLIGTRENTPHPKERPESCFEAARGPVHNRKPPKAYEIIESMYDGAKLEMFSRSEREGWECHGNEL